MRVRATILQTPAAGQIQILENHEIIVDDGVITSVAPAEGAPTADTVVLDSSTVLLPGLIDTHIHAPQWPQLATGLDLPLERWLFEHTFPLEARFADLDFATRVWDDMVPGLLRRGTTTAVYYGSVHEPATEQLARACVAHGQRAFVGRVGMDHPEGTPDYYRDADAAAGVLASQRSIEAVQQIDAGAGLVAPIITPRFIPACTDALLQGLGELAAATGVRVQTHCSESDWEHHYVLDRYGRTDTDALAGFGLATDHSVLAHAGHLTDEDRSTLVSLGAGVAHCPLSNSYFGNGVFSARKALDAGLRVGLGTDIAGGPDGSVLANCSHAVTASRMLEDGVDTATDAAHRGVPNSRIDIATAFWFATGGGAELLGIEAGLLAPGKLFDAIAVSVGPQSSVRIWPEVDDWTRIFEKVVRSTTPADITRVWVQGAEVTPGAQQ